MLVCVGKNLKPPKKKTLMWRSTFNGVCYLILTEFEVDSIRLQTESFPTPIYKSERKNEVP